MTFKRSIVVSRLSSSSYLEDNQIVGYYREKNEYDCCNKSRGSRLKCFKFNLDTNIVVGKSSETFNAINCTRNIGALLDFTEPNAKIIV